MRRFCLIISIQLLLVLLFAPAAVADEQVVDQIRSLLEKSGAADTSDMTDYYEAGLIATEVLPDNARKIDFQEAIRLALERNLDLQSATYAARAAAATLKGSYGLYDPVLSAGYLQGENRDVVNVLPALSAFENEFSETTVSIQQKLPIGTELTLAGSMRNDDILPAPPVSPYYDSRLSLSLVQPLLKGFGTTATSQQIIFSTKDKQIALEDLRDQAFAVIADVRNAYFVILQAQYELSYRQASVELAKRIVRENAARVAAGILPQVETLEAEVGLQARERFLLDAERFYADSLDSFNLLLNAEDEIFVPTMQPFNMRFEASESAGVEAGLAMRPDVLKRLREIEKTRTEHVVAKNALLPELDLVASYGVNGFADDAGDSIDVATDADYDSWEVGVLFSYPLGSIESRNQVKRTELVLKQERSSLTQLYNIVRNEVRAAIRNIDVSRKKTEAASRGHELAREKLRILLKSHEVGLATTREVLDGEEDLAIARTDQIVAVAEYFQAITEYLRVTGTLLESENIAFMGDFGPDLDRSPFYRR